MSQLLAVNVSSVLAHAGATSESDVGEDPPASNQGSVVTSLQPQKGGGLLVSSQPILPTVRNYDIPETTSEFHAINIKQASLSSFRTPKHTTEGDWQDQEGEYIDFNELPQARGLSKSLPPHLEGQLVIVQADDLAVSRKLIPNFETWSQCFVIDVCCCQNT